MHSTWYSSTFLRFLKIHQINKGGPNFLGGTNSAERLNYLVPLLYFNFRNLKNPNSSSFIGFPCLLHHSAVLFSGFWNFLKLKRGVLISWEEPILQNAWIIWSSLVYFNFRSLNDPNSFSFIRFHFILHDSAIIFSAFRKFIKLMRRDIISWREPILQNVWIIWSPFLHFNFRTLKDPNSLSFIRFECILYDSAVPFPAFWKFIKLRRGDLISWRNQCWRTAELFGPHSCTSILEVWRTQIFCNTLDFYEFYMMQ